ncbi:discoidin domain-containing protein [Cohnella silvisoli]|uniref:Discoidin domain-containing protein n=1 Tax=Cohnella silvisoli TaxID=2873699 RepID=A0ABV1KT00_9BACL|nr:discoidin domain-containing protein [Cohnella silvisoli]MCD9021497.1 discoidin domain-containing protein [Cohnella silvisoli]
MKKDRKERGGAVMKKRFLKSGLFVLSGLVIAGVMPLTASAGGTGSFEVGAYWQPPVYIGADYNTNANWANIAAANIDTITAVRVPSGQTLNKSANETGIANSSANNVKLLVTDSDIYGKPIYTAADITALQNLLTPYKNDARVKGINFKDEPGGYEMEGYANAYKVAKAFAPNFDYYVNMLPNHGASSPPGKLIQSNSGALGNGAYVSTANSVGQTITIPAGISYIDGIDMYIDSLQWSSSETLTLKLWNSTAKTSLLGQAAITGNGSGSAPDFHRYFRVAAPVTPGGTYYMELTHNGGGDNSVGWVVRSTGDVYAGGSAYESGAVKTYDFNFRLYTSRDNYGSSYENYLDDWVQYSGADFILYDNYPFRGTSSTDTNSYFLNAELVRGRGLANQVLYGGFMQSVEVRNSAGDVALRAPSLNEMRWNVYTMLTYGFKKMYWFIYWRPDPAGGEYFYNSPVDSNGTQLSNYVNVQTLSSEMRKLGATLKDLTSVRVYHTGTLASGTKALPADFFVKPADLSQPLVFGYFTNASGRKYVMITNRDYTSSKTLNFNFSPKPSTITEISKSTGAEVSVPGYNSTTGVMNLTLSPGEGRLFALPTGFAPYSNLAAEATVTSTSSYESTVDGWGMGKVNDDQRNTIASQSAGWSSNGNTGANHTESITFDLGSVKPVEEIELFPRNDAGNVGQGFPIDFTVKTATSAAGPWTTVLTKTGYPQPGNIGQWFAVTPGTARYVKVEGTNLRRITTEGGQPYRMQFAEVEIYDSPDYAKGALVSASSSVENADWGAYRATDRIHNSVAGSDGWTSNNSLTSNHTESITLDMQAMQTISRVDLFPRNDNGQVGMGFPVNFTIQVAASPSGPWTTVVTQTGYAQPNHLPQSFTFTAQSARYVKVEGTSLRQITTEGGQPYRMQFAEIEIR